MLGWLIWATSPPDARSAAKSLGWALAIVVFTVVFPLYLNPALIGSTGTEWPTIWALATGLGWAVSSYLATATATGIGATIGVVATLVLGIVWPWLYFMVYLAVLLVRGDPIFEF